MSSEQAKKYHSVTFGTKNSWDDWGWIPTSRPSIAPPELIEEDGGADTTDGMLDMTEIYGAPMYSPAKGSMTFLITNPSTGRYSYYQWIKDRSAVMAYLHNRRRRMILDDDPNYYYEGRFTVAFQPGKNYSQVTVSYVLDTYHERLN